MQQAIAAIAVLGGVAHHGAVLFHGRTEGVFQVVVGAGVAVFVAGLFVAVARDHRSRYFTISPGVFVDAPGWTIGGVLSVMWGGLMLSHGRGDVAEAVRQVQVDRGLSIAAVGFACMGLAAIFGTRQTPSR